MKKSEKKTIPPKYILFGMSFFCMILIGLSFVVPGFATPLKETVADIIIPVSAGMDRVGGWFSDRKDDLSEIRDVKAENDALRQQIADLQNENALSVEEKNELSQLRELLELDELYSDYEKVGARIISKDSSNWFSTFTIDKGSEDGIFVDMNVIGNGGLVGIVSSVGKNYAIVRAIIDDESNVSAQIASTSDKCIVKGSLQHMNDGVLMVFNLNKDAKVSEGDMVVTSNISSKFMPGILIGYIKSVENDSNNLTKTAYLTPVVDFAHLDTVLVIKQKKVTGE